jgi:hypothetical protein
VLVNIAAFANLEDIMEYTRQTLDPGGAESQVPETEMWPPKVQEVDKLKQEAVFSIENLASNPELLDSEQVIEEFEASFKSEDRAHFKVDVKLLIIVILSIFSSSCFLYIIILQSSVFEFYMFTDFYSLATLFSLCIVTFSSRSKRIKKVCTFSAVLFTVLFIVFTRYI